MSEKIFFAIPTGRMAIDPRFYGHFLALKKPAGSIASFANGQSPARNRNVLIEQAILSNCTHILFLDDDVILPPDAVDSLLSHDKDIVSALYLMREYPHQPIIFGSAAEDGSVIHKYPTDDECSLIEIVACGLGACLINLNIFKRLEKPYIRLGELEIDQWCDDIGFFKRVREAHIKIYCDLSVQAGHYSTVTILPKYIGGKWITNYITNSPGSVSFPMIRG